MLRSLTVAACALAFVGVQALPNPSPNPVAEAAPAQTITLPDGSVIILGDPDTTFHIGHKEKRDGIISLGPVESETTWDKPNTVPITWGKDKREDGPVLGPVDGDITWDQPITVPITISKDKRNE